MKRFAYTALSRQKLSTLVTFPTKGLDLSNFISKERDDADVKPVYDLFATSNHIGDRETSGHYVANCLADDRWHLYNDSNVTSTTTEQLQGPMTYVLFYRLRES